MALVTLKISSSPAAASDIADALSGGDTGADLGQASNGSYAPLVGAQSANGGGKVLYFSHDATVDPITNVSFYLAEFSGTYGGPASSSPSADLTTIFGQGGDDAGGYANNQDGLASGLHMDMSYAVSNTSQFSPARESTGQKRIFGKTYNLVTVGTQNDPINLHPDSSFYWNGSTKIAPNAPEAGKIGKSSDQTLGNRAEIRLRYCLPSSAAIGGILQWNFVTLFSYTA
jgi:hypothetical protein